MVFIIIGAILLILGLFLSWRAGKYYKQVQEQKEKNLLKLKEQYQALEEEWIKESAQLHKLEEKLCEIQKQVIFLERQENDLKREIDEEIQEKRVGINKLYNNLKETSEQAFSSYEKTLDNLYKEKENQINKQIDKLQQEKRDCQSARDQVDNELTQLKGVFQAATAARLREKEDKEKLFFYQIQLPEKQRQDIEKLQKWKNQLYNPSIVSKIIWSSYIIKPTNDMCNRVLGTKSVSGIYKITNRLTGQIYIGQSVNIADRFKAHIKCGLGIDASTTNKLYNSMQKNGVWNFTFELLEKSPRQKLDTKERFWIGMYQSDKVGLNSTKGNN